MLRRSIGYDSGESGEIRPIAGCNRDQTPAGHGSGYCWKSGNRPLILPIRENSLELRTRDRYRKLLGKIDQALARIDDGSYGYCEETGEEIGLTRLEARPIATLCLDAQERWELKQKQLKDSR